MAESEMKEHVKKIEAAWQTASKLQEDKVSLATQTYEMVKKMLLSKTFNFIGR